MTVLEAITYIEQKLRSEISQHETRIQYAWWILEAVMGQSRANLLTHALKVDQLHMQHVQRYVHDIVSEHKPLAYIIGHVPFGPLSISVEPPILIPRPETEEWVMRILDKIKNPTQQKYTILDLCTGTGCIALLCAKRLPQSRVYAVDINPQAIALAQKNKQQLGIENVTFITSDLFNNLLPGLKYDLMLSNPPYISGAEYEQLAPSVSIWEDKQALYAQNNGLALIQQIIKQAHGYLQTNSNLLAMGVNQLYIEIGWQQNKAVTKLMQNQGYVDITNEKDIAGKDRVISGRTSDVAPAKD